MIIYPICTISLICLTNQQQEIRTLIKNKDHSQVAAEKLLGNITFINFTKTDTTKIGIYHQVHLTRPHWDNAYREVKHT